MFRIDKIFLTPADTSGREKMRSAIFDRHPGTVSVQLGRSILERPIEAFYVGSGRRYIVVVAAHHALESITSNIAYLLVDYLLSKSSSGSINRVDCKTLLSKYCFVVLPCVNPDGIELRYHGADSVLYDRQMRMSGGDFSAWQANARGVDLNHNYDCGFARYKQVEIELGISAGPALFGGEYPESEPESRAVASLVRVLDPRAVVSLHTQGEEIYAFPDSPKIVRVARKLADLTGYRLARPEGTAAYTGLCDYTAMLGIPSFTFELGAGKNPLPEQMIPSIFERVGATVSLLPTFL